MSSKLDQFKAEFARRDRVCHKVLRVFDLISNKTRFRIVCILCHGEFCVSDLVYVIKGVKLSNISQHLKILTLSGILKKRRENQKILYSLADSRISKLMEFLSAQYLVKK